MSELSFQEVYITDPLHVYITCIHTLCVCREWFFGHFYRFLPILWIFWDFYRFLLDFFSFSFLFLFRLSLKKEWGVQFSHFPFSDKFSITNKCKREKFFLSNKSFYKFPLHWGMYSLFQKSFIKTWVSARIFPINFTKKRKKTQKNTKKHDFWLEHENARKSPIFPV